MVKGLLNLCGRDPALFHTGHQMRMEIALFWWIAHFTLSLTGSRALLSSLGPVVFFSER
jgi:hypothetical protein